MSLICVPEKNGPLHKTMRTSFSIPRESNTTSSSNQIQRESSERDLVCRSLGPYCTHSLDLFFFFLPFTILFFFLKFICTFSFIFIFIVFLETVKEEEEEVEEEGLEEGGKQVKSEERRVAVIAHAFARSWEDRTRKLVSGTRRGLTCMLVEDRKTQQLGDTWEHRTAGVQPGPSHSILPANPEIFLFSILNEERKKKTVFIQIYCQFTQLELSLEGGRGQLKFELYLFNYSLFV